MSQGRILGLDFGSKTVGVAVSDPLLLTAQGVEIIRRTKENHLKKTLSRIGELISQYDIRSIVLGFPKNMNGTEGERCEKTIAFKDDLIKRFSLPVVLWDERLTTVSADAILNESDIRGKDRKEVVDEIAAMLILQGYLDRLANEAGWENKNG